jgi:beta-galactosidase
MARLKYYISFVFIICFCKSVNSQVILPGRDYNDFLSLNGIWKFKYYPSSDVADDSLFYRIATDVSNWANIKTPGNWELQGFAEPFYGKFLKEGTGLYRTSFNVPSNWKDHPVYVAFDGVQYGYKLWVNGNYAGSFSSSYNRQVFDISGFVEPGKTAVMALRVTTRSKGWEFDTNDCWSLSGIIRDVSLFSLPETHLKDLVVKTSVSQGSAILNVNTLVERSSGKNISKKITLLARLYRQDGSLVKEFTLNKNKKNGDTSSYASSVVIDNPMLWTAETPYLYTLSVFVNENSREIQKYSCKVGIREVSWNNGILEINGAPVKLRGTDHHDLSPVNGRSVTEAEMLEDLKLMREANINFVRTSHYQPQERFIELCDSLGFYVMEEVPFGFGDEHLYDKTYLPVLKERAKSTVWRDKNHPSIIVWSVGNENPLTPICVETGDYVKELDNTRPHCFPQVGSYFRKICDTIPASVDILSPHYPVPSVLKEYASRFSRPMIVTEYAHSLGLDFDRMEALWEIMYASPGIAGGAVWHFFDQGLLRKSAVRTYPGAFTTSVWTDSVTVYDNNGNQGADGLVYANRVPQVDYWQVRKVYSPVKALDDIFCVSSGKQTVSVKLINRYDFTNLSQNKCFWKLFADTSIIDSGECMLICNPHDTVNVPVELNIPETLSASYYYLKLEFINKDHYSFFEKTYPLHLRNYKTDFLAKLGTSANKPVLKNSSIEFGNYLFTFNNLNGKIKLTSQTGSDFILDGPYVRMGRKATMSSIATIERKNETSGKKKTLKNDDPLLADKTVEENPLWSPYLLKESKSVVESVSNKQVVVTYTFQRENAAGQFISGRVKYSVSDSGFIKVKYNFVPVNAKGIALEAGISFLLPSSFTEFRWAGKGPYPAYPGKSRLCEFGLYHLNNVDINYQGNREDVDIAVFTNSLGCGLAIVADKANIAVENSPEGIIVSHNAFVSGRFNKGSMPEQTVQVENLKEISGSFSIIPLTSTWPQFLTNLFGASNHTAVPFKPFYNSYDQ